MVHFTFLYYNCNNYVHQSINTGQLKYISIAIGTVFLHLHFYWAKMSILGNANFRAKLYI